MSHQDIIQTLIEWIDEHIDQPLNIDIVARKSGYSKWYLQRMFRTVMHQTLGDYIRQRRLLLAAQSREEHRALPPRKIRFAALSFEEKKAVAAQLIRRINLAEDSAEIFWTV